MSQRNKLDAKCARKFTREQQRRVLEMQSTRQPLTHIPRDVASRVLLDSKAKLTSKKRKRFMRSFAAVVTLPTQEPRDPAVKVCLKLRDLPLVGVIRLIKKSARRAATAKYLLEQLDPASKFRILLEAQQTFQLGVLKQARAEYQVRTT